MPGRIARGPTRWGFFTVDVKRGIVYAPLGAPTSDFYGADRVGDGLYGNSLVALDARTGAKKWHRQLVHHDLWDYDLAAPPALFDIRRGGRVIPAVAQITKMGLLFVFDRVTGEPVYGMEERPVPQSAVPGEATSKTQPFPLKPPPLGRNTFRVEELYDRSPEHATLLQGAVRNQPDEDRLALTRLCRWKATRCSSPARWAGEIGAACRSILRSACCSST